jgi:hypothetical protein
MLRRRRYKYLEAHPIWIKKQIKRLKDLWKKILSPSQIISHYKNLGESKHLKFD